MSEFDGLLGLVTVYQVVKGEALKMEVLCQFDVQEPGAFRLFLNSKWTGPGLAKNSGLTGLVIYSQKSLTYAMLGYVF